MSNLALTSDFSILKNFKLRKLWLQNINPGCVLPELAMLLRFCAWIDDWRDLRGVSSSENHIRWMWGIPGCARWRAGGGGRWPAPRRTPRCGCARWSSQWSCLVARADGATGLRLLSCRGPGPVTLKKHQRWQWPRTQMLVVVVVLHRQLSRYPYLSQSLGAWAGPSSCSRPPRHCSLCPPCPPPCSRPRSWSARACCCCCCSDRWPRGRGSRRWPSCGSCRGWGRVSSWRSPSGWRRSGRGHPTASGRPGRWWSTSRTVLRSPETRRSSRLSQLRARPVNRWGGSEGGQVDIRDY